MKAHFSIFHAGVIVPRLGAETEARFNAIQIPNIRGCDAEHAGDRIAKRLKIS